MSAFVSCSSLPGDLLLLGNHSATGIQEETREAVMATRKKATGKTKAKRKKAAVKVSTRRKTTAARRKPKKAVKKAPLRGSSPKKTQQTAVKSSPVRLTPIPPAEPAASEERIGVVTHYYSHLSVAAIQLERGTLRVGDVIHICGHTTDFRQRVESLEVDHAPTSEVGPKDDIGLKVVDHAREHDGVFKVRS
jgi:hypothetical protein